MNSLARLAVTLFAFCSASFALAATPSTNHYMSISYFDNSAEFSTDAGAYRVPLDNVNLRYGYKFFNFLSVEGLVGTSDELIFEDDGTRVKNDYLIGVFARGSLNLPAQNISLYGLLGASRAKLTYTIDETSLVQATNYTVTANGLSFGAGIELFGAPSTSFHVEWMRYLDTNYLTTEGWVLGLTHYFVTPGWR